MKKTILFVGGPADGKRIAVQDADYVIHMPIMRKVDVVDNFEADMSTPSSAVLAEYAVYRRLRFCFQRGSTDIFCADSLVDGHAQVFEKLVAGYKTGGSG